MAYLAILSRLARMMPVYTSHPDNTLYPSPVETPSHVVPEWYFLPPYAALKAVPSFLTGLLFFVVTVMVSTGVPATGKRHQPAVLSALTSILALVCGAQLSTPAGRATVATRIQSTAKTRRNRSRALETFPRVIKFCELCELVER